MVLARQHWMELMELYLGAVKLHPSLALRAECGVGAEVFLGSACCSTPCKALRQSPSSSGSCRSGSPAPSGI